MRMILAGGVLLLAGLGVLLAMVVRAIEPGIALSLVSYAAAFVGTGLIVGGVIQRVAGRR